MFIIFKTTNIILIVLSILNIASVLASTGFTNQQSIYFTGDSSSPKTFYQDALDGNSDVGIELCDSGSNNFSNNYVGAVYALHTTTWHYALITYESSSNALAQLTQTSGSCHYTQPGYITISPSTLSSTSPNVYKAALPGNLWITYTSISKNPGVLDKFEYSNGNAVLRGSYSMQASFDQSSRDVTVQKPTITFVTSSGSFTKNADDSSYGVSSERPMVLGLCDDDHGASCESGSLLTSFSSAKTLSSGLSSSQVNDQHTYTRYIVMNGIGSQMCIGANLYIADSDISVSQNPIYYSQYLNITFTIHNPRGSGTESLGGNVDVTSNFNVKVLIYPSTNTSNYVFNQTYTISDDVAVDSSVSKTITWEALAHSGTYYVKVIVDNSDSIDECDESTSSNTATTTFELKPITIPTILIDGISTSKFPVANVPYNLTLHFENSDNDVLNNASVLLIETNGLNLNVPTQVYNITIDGSGNTQKTGTLTKTTTYLTTDYYGNITITYIPTYNKLYSNQYSYTHIDDYIGNHSITLSGAQSDGETFIFIDSTKHVSSEYNLTINQTDYSGDHTSKSLIHEDIVSQTLDFIYQTFVVFLDSIS